MTDRKGFWGQRKPKPRKYRRGTLRLFSEHAASPMEGACLRFED